MKCLHCGQESDNYLCDDHSTESILDEVFNALRFYKAGKCDNAFIREYAMAFEKPYEVRSCIPNILKLFPESVADFYFCRYYKGEKDERFEEAALTYLHSHPRMAVKEQTILLDLLDYYLRDDFVKPQKWCELIKNTDSLYCELYHSAAQFYAMIGDYDIAGEIIDKALALCTDSAYNSFLFCSRETGTENLTKLKETNNRYRTKKPYWPATEERRRLVAAIYDEKGITYPRIESKPAKVSESDFKPIDESLSSIHTNYCAFWCAEAFSIVAAKSIYQIAAVKVRNGIIVDEFQSYVRPWSENIAGTAEKAGIDANDLLLAEDVDQVMSKFFAFAEDDVMISTGALGNQAKLISRAARYSGMTKITNEFFDLLDYAADVSSGFDMQNNTREHLLSHLALKEGVDSLEKAKKNMNIYTRLMGVDK